MTFHSTIRVVLLTFPKLEEWIYNVRERRTYEVVCEIDRDKREQLGELVRACGLCVKGAKLAKSAGEMICTWDAYGSPESHKRLVERLLVDSEVKAFRF